jgi:GNAT superfamily N-acetyltransferase
MPFNFDIRGAVPADSDALTEISFAAKRYWRYPEEYFDIWENELTITPENIYRNIVIAACINNRPIGFYSIVDSPDGFVIKDVRMPAGLWLEHIFIRPSYIGNGFGRILLSHAEGKCMSTGHKTLHVLSDPNTKDFYLKFGYDYIDDIPSTIEDRTTPYLRRVL